ITTPYDSFTVARLINQSIPVDYFMTKENLITCFEDDFIKDITETMAKVRHRSFPVLNAKHKYVGMFSRRHLLDMSPKQIILVDHNEFSQAVDGVEDAELLEIIDHHRIGGHQTSLPVFFRNQPLGCSNTIIFHMFKEKGFEIEPQIAGLMLSAILSDTLMFRSPTCTPIDVAAGKELAKMLGVDYEKHALAMFEAGSDFGDKTPKEILFTDFKIFTQGDIDFGVSQISVVSQNQIDKLSPDIAQCLEDAVVEKGVDMIFCMLTNVIEQKSEVICFGKDSEAVIANGFGEDALTGERTATLPGVVSRKKQMVPSLTRGLTQL
ncbi:MAG: putative manganese-dependent inorganic diphosphatase, partial [Lachnospiraceae bacterium]|nr:putative manganese-dependent inorganic diphosphatase [Lachnospiraceae bacterium]